MNAHQRRRVRRECMRTMTPGTEVKLRGRSHTTVVTVVEAVPWREPPRVRVRNTFDFGRQHEDRFVPFTRILAYRRPT